MDDETHLEHEWGPVEFSPLSGTPHRKCQVPGCHMLTLDLDDDDEDEDDESDS